VARTGDRPQCVSDLQNSPGRKLYGTDLGMYQPFNDRLVVVRCCACISQVYPSCRTFSNKLNISSAGNLQGRITIIFYRNVCGDSFQSLHVLIHYSQVIRSRIKVMADVIVAGPPFPDVNRGPGILAVSWIEASLGIIILSLRMYTRAKITRKIGWDDWTMVFATVSFESGFLCTQLSFLLDTCSYHHHHRYFGGSLWHWSPRCLSHSIPDH
jgi:hypothetical protein